VRRIVLSALHACTAGPYGGDGRPPAVRSSATNMIGRLVAGRADTSVKKVRSALASLLALLAVPAATVASEATWSVELVAREASWAGAADTVGSHIELPDRFLVPYSERITVDGSKILRD
jgi:hypothetical protein